MTPTIPLLNTLSPSVKNHGAHGVARPTLVALFICAVALLCGCSTASRDINPATPRPGRGYADLFTDPKADVWWKVDVYDAANQGYKEFTAEFASPPQGIFRVEAKPGRHKARVSVVNKSIEAPAEIEVEIREGMITPIRVSFEQAGNSYVRTVEDRGTPVIRNKVTDKESKVWRISAKAEAPVPYSTREHAAYWK